MPPRKPVPMSSAVPAHAPYAPLFMVVIVALLTIALLLVWRELPTGSKPMPAAPIGDVKPVPAASTSTEQVACEAARGKWVECGNPCQGKPGEVCITKCEPQCLCGGIAGWMCPANLTCTDMVPESGAPDALGVCRPKPMVTAPVLERPAGMVCDDTNVVCVDPSFAKNTLTNPLYATGTITVSNSGIVLISWEVIDGKSNHLDGGDILPDRSEFSLRGFLSQVPATATGTLRLYMDDDRQGTRRYEVVVPVKLPTATMVSRFYMLPPTVGNDCSILEPVEATVPRSGLPVETSLRALLEMGPTMSSKRTAIPQGTRLESLKVSGGTATVVFSPELENYGGGSCNVQAIRAQIETTLKQFPSIKNVVISVFGKTAVETLQP